jgi:hypothetical protein
MSGDVGKGDVAEAEGVRKKPRLELKLQLDESWGRSSTASNGTVATMDTNGGSTQGLLPERESKPRLREVLVQSARQGLRARGPAVQSFIATPYT